MKKDLFELLKFVLIFILMIFSVFIVKTVFELFGIIYTPNNYFLYSIYDFIGSLLIIISLIIVHRKTLKEDFKKLFKEKNKLIKFIVFIFVGYFFVINIEVVCGIIQSILFHIFNLEVATSDNQQKLESIIHAAPYFMVISTCLFAPLEEELLFRGSIRRTIKNKGVFIAVSGLFFGLLHITDNYILLVLLLLECFALSEIIESKAKTANKVGLSVISVAIFVSIFIGTIIVVHGNLYNYFYSIDPKEIINGITYVTLGCYFASIYAFTNNIYYTIGIHIVTNTIATILLLTL